MKCKICDGELNIPKIACKCCHNEVNIANEQFIDFIVAQYADIQNKINKYSKEDYTDTYEIKAIKNTKLEVYNEMSSVLKHALK